MRTCYCTLNSLHTEIFSAKTGQKVNHSADFGNRSEGQVTAGLQKPHAYDDSMENIFYHTSPSRWPASPHTHTVLRSEEEALSSSAPCWHGNMPAEQTAQHACRPRDPLNVTVTTCSREHHSWTFRSTQTQHCCLLHRAFTYGRVKGHQWSCMDSHSTVYLFTRSKREHILIVDQIVLLWTVCFKCDVTLWKVTR